MQATRTSPVVHLPLSNGRFANTRVALLRRACSHWSATEGGAKRYLETPRMGHLIRPHNAV